MTTPIVAPYGTWTSKITSDFIVQDAISIVGVLVDPITSVIYHLEGRPSEEGRTVIVETIQKTDVFGPGFNATSLVHSYGGGAAVVYGGTVYFSNVPDCRVYRVFPGGTPEAVTPVNDEHRFSDFTVYPTNPYLIVAILEDHSKGPKPSDVVNTLCVINTITTEVSTLVSGADFYAAPRFSPDGKYIAYQQWNLPDMPWEGGMIYVAAVDTDGSNLSILLRDTALVAGKGGAVSAGYPTWTSNETLLFTNDVSGFSNPWSYSVTSAKSAPILANPVDEDFAVPAWMLGDSYGTNVDADGGVLFFMAIKDGHSVLYLIHTKTGTLEPISNAYSEVSQVRHVTIGSTVFSAGMNNEPATIVLLNFSTSYKPTFTPIMSTANAASKGIAPDMLSPPQPMTLLVPPDEEPLYVNYYPPTNPDYVGPAGERPPCVVGVHGGPTSNATQSLNWTTQFFTSRGFAWLDVNYRGSSGYGREYISKLDTFWGILDVDDCVIAVQILSKTLIDSQMLFIRGGSSGGFTALASVCSYPDVFAGATSKYGISDLTKLVVDTHKFESKYMDKLLGGSIEQIPEVYHERSPVNNADKIKSPLLILQGSEDKVVPPEQSQVIVDAIEANHGRVKYILFQGEGHGFKIAANIKKSLEEELAWYVNLLGNTA